MSLRFFLLLLVILHLPHAMIRAQETLGVPDISNFLHEEIKAGAQNWQVIQGKNGYIYVANNMGLLLYNNKQWRTFVLPNKTILRSIAIAADGKIYVGGQDMLGYYFPDNRGSLVYHSLTHLLLSEDRNFGDVWNIETWHGEIFMRTSRKIFRYSPEKRQFINIYIAKAGAKWSYLGKCNDTLYAQSGSENLVLFDGRNWQSAGAGLLKTALITSMLEFSRDTLLVSTLRTGFFLYSRGKAWPLLVASRITEAQVYTSCRVNDSTFAIGTVSAGVFFINMSGVATRHFYTKNGMQNNNVLSLFIDDQQNLWAGLDQGIDRIDFNSSIKIIPPVADSKTPTYAMLFANRHLYAGTSDGVYSTQIATDSTKDISLSPGNFERITRTDGQVWNLDLYRGHVLVGHHDGTLLIQGNTSFLLGREGGGTWLFRTLPGRDTILTGTYAGLQSLLYSEKKFYRSSITGNYLKESLRFVEIDFIRHVAWASHPYRGIYKIQLSADYSTIEKAELLAKNQGLPGTLNNYVFKLKDEIVFATDSGVYQYDWNRKQFIPSTFYGKQFGNIPLRYMRMDAKGRIWFVSGKRMGVMDHGQIKYFPELDGMLIAGFENIYPLNDNNIFANSYKGIIHLNLNQYQTNKTSLALWLNRVSGIYAKKDSVLFDGFFAIDGQLLTTQSKKSIPRLAPAFNSLHFEYSVTQFSRSGAAVYSHRLKGLDNEWSDWSEKTEKDYTNLPYGKYSFEVKVKDNLENISPVVSYSFVILPRWYQTWLAYTIYFGLLIGLGWLLHLLQLKRLESQRIKFEKEEAQLKKLHELEITRSENEIFRLQTEKLETEVGYKNKELALTTMHLYKRGRLLGKIKEELADATQNLSSKEEKVHFNKLLKLIAEEEKRDSDWEQFSIHFDQVHNQFLQKLKSRFPELTPSDLKIAAYIKINLSSKEIAQLLNISLKGVEIARYRLRKKLQLESTTSITEYLITFS